MAGFSIASPATTVLLRRTREGSASGAASFTVANQTGHAVRARAMAVPEGSTDPSWLDVEKAERNFQTGANETFVVVLTVPQHAAPGEYQFRMDAASVSIPDEEWGRGSSVRFQVPEVVDIEPEPPKEEEPGYLETVGGALLGAFVVAVILLGVGLAVGLGAASGGGGGTGGGGDPGEVVGRLIGEAIGAMLVVVFIAIAFAGLGAWLGPVIGAFLVLRFRDFKDPWLTAAPMVILMPLLGLPIVLTLGAIAQAIGIGGVFGTVWAVLALLIAISGPAAAARAFARWRQTGHL